MSNPRPREVLNAVHSVKEKGPPVADGTLSVTADASEATEFCSRRSALDFVATTSTYLEDDSDGRCRRRISLMHHTPSLS